MSEKAVEKPAEEGAAAASGSNKIVIILMGVIVLLLAAIVVLFFTPIGRNLISPPQEKHGTKSEEHAEGGEEHAEGKEKEKVDPKTLIFTALPEVLINLRSKDGGAGFLKATFIIESNAAELAHEIDALKPQIIDQFQIYLRELDLDDLKGSAGIQRVRQELVARVNNIISPKKIRSVLIKEFILQ